MIGEGKCLGVYLMFPEQYYKDTLKVEAKKRGMGVDQYCEWVLKRYHECEEWRGT